jgi:predicted small metal-binding protein
MKTTIRYPLIIATLGFAAIATGIAQDAKKMPPVLKSVSCAPECGFMARTHDEKELIAIVKTHAKQAHGKELTDAQIKEMIKTEKPKG